MNRFIWFNGEVLPEERAVVSIYDSAMMYGDAAFTMLRTFNGRPFQWPAHVHRLYDAAQMLGIPHQWLDQVSDGYAAMTRANRRAFRPDDEIRTLITLSRGPLPLYQHLKPEPWLMMCQYPLRWVLRGKSYLYRHGVHAWHTEVPPLPDACVPSTLKHHNRVHFRRAEQMAALRELGAWALIHQDTELKDPGIVEATNANIFVVRKRRLFYPERGCLRGISARFVIERLAERVGLQPYSVRYLGDVSSEPNVEVFFTCTPFSIVPCTRIDKQPIGNGNPGPLTTELTKAWIRSVHCNFVKQAERWDADAVS